GRFSRLPRPCHAGSNRRCDGTGSTWRRRSGRPRRRNGRTSEVRRPAAGGPAALRRPVRVARRLRGRGGRASGAAMTVHRGVSVAPGIAMGVVYLRGYESEEDFPLRIPSDQVENELNRLRSAIELSRRQIEDLKERHGETLGDAELRIFDVHIAYLSDPMFVDEIEKLVLEERFSVRAAIRKVVDDYDRIFQLVESENLRQRAGDFRDVATRLKRNVAAMNEEAPPPKPPPAGRYVLAARKLTVNDL